MRFLVDTGSELSLIKPSGLDDDVMCTRLKKPIKLEGIGNGIQVLDHCVNLTIENTVSHNFKKNRA